MKFYLYLFLTFFLAHSLLAKEKKLESFPPDIAIANSRVKVELHRERTPILRWEVRIYYFQKKTKTWEEYFKAHLRGNFSDANYAKEYREKYQVYYAFQKPGQIVNIKTTKRTLSFRVKTFEKFWMNNQVSILNKSPFVLFECTGKSHDQLTPHWSVSFTKGPLIELVTEQLVRTTGTSSINAKKTEGHSIHAKFSKYCLVFKNADPNFFAIFPTENQPLNAQFPRKNGLGSTFLNTPFIIYGGTQKFTKNAHTAAHVGEGLYSEIKKLLPEIKGRK